MANKKEKVEDVAAKADEPVDSAGTNAPKAGRYSPRWVRVCVSKSLASSTESESTSPRPASDKTPWRRTRRKS